MSDTFSYNGLDTRVGKVEAGGTRTFRRDGAGVTDAVLSDGSAVYTAGVSQRRSGATTYDLSDRLGTSTHQTSAAKATTATRAYDAFGLLVASTGTPQGPFGFAGAHGYQEDGDAGLKLLGHRYYDPSTGRFLTRDPAQDGRNWYAYCENDPLKWVDPKGFYPWGERNGGDVYNDQEPGHDRYKVIAIGEQGGTPVWTPIVIPPGHKDPKGYDVDYVVVIDKETGNVGVWKVCNSWSHLGAGSSVEIDGSGYGAPHQRGPGDSYDEVKPGDPHPPGGKKSFDDIFNEVPKRMLPPGTRRR